VLRKVGAGIPPMRASVLSRIARDWCSASAQSAGARFHQRTCYNLQEHTGECMVPGL